MDVRPQDRYQCAGCGQLLIFGADGFVPDEQLAACQRLCSWTLVFRAGLPVASAAHSRP